MLKKEQVLNTLKKYGFYSLNRAPFLYQSNEEIGVYFVWPHKHYGNLERVMFFDTLEELEESIYKFWWFSNHKEKYPVEVLFDNYEIITPKVTYLYKGTELTLDMMKNFQEVQANFVDPRESLKKQQLLRTANILLLILKEKFKEQNETYLQVVKMSENLKQLMNTFNLKLKEYRRDKEEVKISSELLTDDHDDSEEVLKTLHSDLAALEEIEDIRAFIDSLYLYLADLESSEVHFQNVYLLKRYTYEIEDMKQKIAVLDNVLKSKKKLFQKEQDPMQLIMAIEKNSKCNQMENVTNFIEREKKKVLQKYQNKEKISEDILGDYLSNFENMDVKLPETIQNSLNETLTLNDLSNELKQKFNQLSKQEQSACYVASSFLKECIYVLLDKHATEETDLNEVISKIVLDNQIDMFHDAYMTLDSYLNAKIRVKYFDILNTNNFEGFISSLVDVVRILEQMTVTLDKGFYGYYNEKAKEIIFLHLKNLFNHTNKKQAFVVNVLPNVPIYYSPISIVKNVDILENTELLERENEIVFLLKNKISIKTDFDKITVVRYEKDQVVKEDNVLTVLSTKEKTRCDYYEDTIQCKGDEE